jgi:parallel beta-helix repeat protein
VHRRRPVRVLVFAVVALLVALPACGRDQGSGPEVREVGKGYRSIQTAVDAAAPGDLVLIPPGTYHEAVKVTTPRLVIRGTDRNQVILDGRDELQDGFLVTADQVAVENLTVRRFAQNGVIFTGPYDSKDPQAGPVGWRASYVTAANNGLYGLYAFGTGAGQFDHSYASGSPDSGIYVGQCRRCGAVVTANVMEHNAIGYENTNASGVTVAANVVRANRIGMVVASGVTEKLAPQGGDRIVANLVTDNDDPATPESAHGGFGAGIVIAGGTRNEVSGNVVSGHTEVGILVTDQDRYDPAHNQVRGNRMSANAVDLAVSSTDGSDLSVAGNCFAANQGATATAPAELENLLPCSGSAPSTVPGGALVLADPPKGVEYTTVSLPGPQPQMPGARERRWLVPARTAPAIDLTEVRVPQG